MQKVWTKVYYPVDPKAKDEWLGLQKKIQNNQQCLEDEDHIEYILQGNFDRPTASTLMSVSSLGYIPQTLSDTLRQVEFRKPLRLAFNFKNIHIGNEVMEQVEPLWGQFAIYGVRNG